MPRRDRLDLDQVAAWGNLVHALWRAARGKRRRPDVARFLEGYPASLVKVQAALLEGRLPEGRWTTLTVRDPKPRLIHAAPFASRVAHHALIACMEPHLEKRLVGSSFACRPGLGSHRALAHAQACLRRHPWYVKLDVRHCFPSIPHAGLLALLGRRFKGSAMLLVRAIVQQHEASPGRGLPIGSLTSQHFANQYLGELDRALMDHAACLAHARYMDDLVLWAQDVTSARRLVQVAQDTATAMGLVLKEPVLQQSRFGLSWLGMKVHRGRIALGPRRKRLWIAQLRHVQAAAHHQTDARSLQEAFARLEAHTSPAHAGAWRRRQLIRIAGTWATFGEAP